MYNPIPYSDEYAEFCRLRYGTSRIFFETLPVFLHTDHGIKTAEIPYSNYYLELNGGIDPKKLFDHLEVDMVKVNLLNHPGTSRFVALILDIGNYQSTEDLLRRRVALRRRNQIRFAYKQNLHVKLMGAEGLDEFYELYKNQHEQRKFRVRGIAELRIILDAFGDKAKILGVYDADRMLPGLLLVLYGPVLWLIVNASDFEFSAKQANNLAYWEAIKYGFDHGVKQVDFGGTPIADYGNIQYKKGFGVTASPIYSGLFFRNFRTRVRYWISHKLWHLTLRFR